MVFFPVCLICSLHFFSEDQQLAFNFLLLYKVSYLGPYISLLISLRTEEAIYLNSSCAFLSKNSYDLSLLSFVSVCFFHLVLKFISWFLSFTQV